MDKEYIQLRPQDPLLNMRDKDLSLQVPVFFSHGNDSLQTHRVSEKHTQPQPLSFAVLLPPMEVPSRRGQVTSSLKETPVG